MVRRRSSVRAPSSSPFAFTPAISISPPVGRSSSPAIWSKVDLPAPDGPTRATSSPACTAQSAPRRMLSCSVPWPKVITILDRRSAVELASFITQRLDRIDARRPPGRDDAEDEAQSQGDHDDIGHLKPVDLRRYLRKQVELGRKEVAMEDALQQMADVLDIGDEQHSERDA